jgi:hypothetical protein
VERVTSRKPTRDAGIDKASMASVLGAFAVNGVLASIYAAALLAPATHKEFIAAASTYFLLEFLILHFEGMLRGGRAGAWRVTLFGKDSDWDDERRRPGGDRPPSRAAAAGLAPVYIAVAAMASIAQNNSLPLVMFVASLGAKVIRRRGTETQETAAGARLGSLMSLSFGAFVLAVVLVFGAGFVHLFLAFDAQEWQSQLFVLWGLLYFGSQTVIGAREAARLARSAPDRIGQRQDTTSPQ